MIKFLTSEIGYGICCSLLAILLTHFLKQLFKSSAVRKRYTPLITLGLGIIASVVYYLTIKWGTLDFGEIKAYMTIAVYGLEIAIAATGIYISIKRIFNKSSEDDITLDELFKTAENILPQGLLLLSNFVGGDLPTAETLYDKIKSEAIIGFEDKKETVDQVVARIVTILNGWTNTNAMDINSQAKMLVQAVKNELEVAKKAAEAEEAKKQETKTEENKEIKI